MTVILLKFWRLWAVGGLVLLLGLQSARLSHARAATQTAREALMVAQAAIAQQNSALAAMEADGARRARALDAALKVGGKSAASAGAQAKRLEAMRPGSGDICDQLLSVDRAVLADFR